MKKPTETCTFIDLTESRSEVRENSSDREPPTVVTISPLTPMLNKPKIKLPSPPFTVKELLANEFEKRQQIPPPVAHV